MHFIVLRLNIFDSYDLRFYGNYYRNPRKTHKIVKLQPSNVMSFSTIVVLEFFFPSMYLIFLFGNELSLNLQISFTFSIACF